MRCASCRADNRDGIRFCEQCGAALATPCPTCGASLPPEAKFCGACGAPRAQPPAERFTAPHAYTPAHLAERILRERSALAGERKQVTVLFADVSGFTSISERLDPEDVHALINRAFELMLAEIHRYEGTVNQFLGDGLMALFGAPIAHEDHARRAAHAALGMQRALGRYRDELAAARGIDFRVRMGLNTGLVVVGAIGDNLRMDYTAVGDTTNTAARMQQLAEPGQIVVAGIAHRLIEPFFTFRHLGTFTVKNRAEPVEAYDLTDTRDDVSRLAARAVRGLSPFVGREDAVATLERALEAARGGRGQVALVVGDPGLGKSRLLLELRDAARDSVTWLEGECLSFGQSTPFLPLVSLLKRRFGIDHRDGEPDVIGKIERGLAALGVEPAHAPFVRYLLSVDPGDPAVAAMDAAQRRTRIVGAIQHVIAAASRQRPTVVVIEDAHWIDTASEECLRSLIDALPGMAVLLVVTYRPLDQQPFGDRTYFWRIALQPIDEGAALRIAEAALGVATLPAELASVITRKAEGNPFFLEEISRTLVETHAVRVENGRLALTGTAGVVTVPDTVQDVIAARIDRLDDPQKRTVQTAACIGREFTLTLLDRVSDVHAQLERCLTELKRIELIYEKALGRDPEFVFRHALTQDVAYASMLQSERRRLHALIGRAMEDVYAGRLEERTEELVHHFARGEVWDKVARYAREAGDRAARLFLDAKAVEFYELAAEALGRLPETADTARQAIDVRLAMRPPLWRAGRLDPLHERFREAEALATRHGIADVLDTVYAYLVQYHWAKGQPELALEYGERCLETATARDDLALRVTGYFYRAHAYQTMGRHREAIAECAAIHEALAGREHERFGLSGLPYCGAAGMAAWSLAEMGDIDGALALAERGEAVAGAANHLYSACAIKGSRAMVLNLAGRVDEAIALVEPVLATCREKNFAGHIMLTACTLAHGYAARGRGAEAAALAREAIELQDRLGAWSDRSWMHVHKALGHLAAGQLDEADGDVARALELTERHSERGWEAWARYAGALVAQRRGDDAAAARHADEAQEIAEELALRPLLERCRVVLRRVA
jgi:class 3 adenylate cyclase/tetratricopeptide (TPR) repeat protein